MRSDLARSRSIPGSVVTYDAQLTLKSVLGIFDPLLGRSFRKIGDGAAAGLRRVLEAPPPPD